MKEIVEWTEQVGRCILNIGVPIAFLSLIGIILYIILITLKDSMK